MSNSKNIQIKHAQIKWSDQLEPFSPHFDDHYFNTQEGIEESNYVFLQGNDLNTRWLNCIDRFFCIAESGFGTGLNFLNTCLLFQQFLALNPNKPLKQLFFCSFEKYPLSKNDLIKALERWPSLSPFIQAFIEQYPPALKGCQRIKLSQFNVTLDLWFGDISETLEEVYLPETGLFDCWFLDGFSPHKNPEMWNLTLFKQIANSCKNDACIATFTAAGFVRRALQEAGFNIQKRKGYGKKREMLIGQLALKKSEKKANKNNEFTIIGGGISSACLTLALIQRGYKITLYCKDKQLAEGASSNLQGAVYPLLNAEHDSLSQFFANAFLYSRNFITRINKDNPFDFDLSGLLQLYYDPIAATKLDKIACADFPTEFVCKKNSAETDKIAQLDIGQTSLYYPLAGWVNPKQMVNAIFNQAKIEGDLTLHFEHHLKRFDKVQQGWECHFTDKKITAQQLILATAMETLNFKQCEAIPLSAARGQVTHIASTPALSKLKVAICHEGYLTPSTHNLHCMGATFKRHQLNTDISQPEQFENKEKLDKCITDKEWVKQIQCDHLNANAAIRTMTRDHFPYLGQVADYQQIKTVYAQTGDATTQAMHEDLYTLTGLGARGLCSAPLLGELLASLINHEPLPVNKTILNKMSVSRQWLSYLSKGKALKF